MDKYLKKAEIVTKYFGIYGKGNFDLSLEEIARIIEFLCTKDNDQYLDVNLQELYERLEKIRMG
jgi:hypothetical protein